MTRDIVAAALEPGSSTALRRRAPGQSRACTEREDKEHLSGLTLLWARNANSIPADDAAEQKEWTN